jgi:hypothetical protein
MALFITLAHSQWDEFKTCPSHFFHKWTKKKLTGQNCGTMRTFPDMYGLRFSQQWLWRILSSEIQCCVFRWKSSDISEEHVTSIFMVKETSVDFPRTTQCYIHPNMFNTCNRENGISTLKDCVSVSFWKLEYSYWILLILQCRMPIL